MSIGATLLVLLAAVMHASWNAATKASRDPLVTMGLIALSGGVLALLFVPWTSFPARGAWPFLAGSLVLHLGYQLFLVSAYRWGDLSQVYPIARGVAPCLLAVLAAGFAGERLSEVAAAGLLIASISLSSLAFTGSGSRLVFERRGVMLALITAAFIASYTCVDALGARLSGNVWGFIVWMHVLDAIPMVLVVAWLRRGRLRDAVGLSWRPGVVGGVLAALGYTVVIWVVASHPMAHVSALRETSVLFAALIGWLFLGESFGRRRVLASIGTVVGLVALQL